jgi:hypothetical protein
MEEQIINKVDQSGLITIDLESYYPKGERIFFDLKDQLFQGMILREKDLREFVKNENWSRYDGSYVAIGCSADAIVPTWAFMLIATKLTGHAKKIVAGNLETLETVLYSEALSSIDPAEYMDAKVVIKGCSNLPVPASAYVALTATLLPFAKSIMYGEPCSTVPLYKKPK